MSDLFRDVFGGQAGYPRRQPGGSFDPAMGRGYRGGNRVLVPAGAVNQTLSNHGQQDLFFRWKIVMHCAAADGVTYAANTAYYVSLVATGKNENDEISRQIDVALDGGQIVYTTGRSLTLVVSNPTARDLVVHYALDEATPGLSPFRSNERLVASNGTPVELSIPPFTQELQLFGLTGGVGWILRGYDSTGALVYTETLGAPRSAVIPVLPMLFYTIEPTAGANQVALVQYSCLG